MDPDTHSSSRRQANFDSETAYVDSRGIESQEQVPGLKNSPKVADESGNLPPILVASLPKSGTVFIAKSLRDGLKLSDSTSGIGKMVTKGAIQLDGGRFPDIYLNYSLLKAFSRQRKGGIGISHLPPNRYNLAIVSQYLDKVVVNVRDPRQAILSFTHHINELNSTEPSLISTYDFYERYFSDSLSNQIDYQIETWLPVFINWIMKWVQAGRNPDFGARILFTRFEDLKSNQAGYFDRILKFYGIDDVPFYLPAVPKKGELHFRKGKIDEWRDVFSHEQASTATRMMPECLFEIFGWAPT